MGGSGSDTDERLLSEPAFVAIDIVVGQMEEICGGSDSAGVLAGYDGSLARTSPLYLHTPPLARWYILCSL